MSASKDTKRGTWKVYIRYIDWMGNKQIKTKRGFQTKKEALAWEREFLQSQSKDMNMSFKAFAEIYMNDMKPRIRESTMENKRYIIDNKLIPYFGSRSLASIKASDAHLYDRVWAMLLAFSIFPVTIFLFDFKEIVCAIIVKYLVISFS